MLVGIDQPRLAGIGDKHLMTALGKQPAYPGRVGTDLDDYLHPLLRIEAASEVVGDGAQPTVFHKLAGFRIQHAQVAVFVAEIQPYRPLRSSPATITHGSILLPGLLEPEVICRPSRRVLREDRLSHLIWCGAPRGGGGSIGLLGDLLGGDHHSEAAHLRRLESLPMGKPTSPSTMTYPRSLLVPVGRPWSPSESRFTLLP